MHGMRACVCAAHPVSVQRLLQLNNFNTAMAILHGINQWAVSASSIYQVYSVQSLKLTTVWPELSKRDKKVPSPVQCMNGVGHHSC